jgi:hypothetical protein
MDTLGNAYMHPLTRAAGASWWATRSIDHWARLRPTLGKALRLVCGPFLLATQRVSGRSYAVCRKFGFFLTRMGQERHRNSWGTRRPIAAALDI